MDKTEAYNATLATLRRDLVEAENRAKQLREAISVIEKLIPQGEMFFRLGGTMRVLDVSPLTNLSMIEAAERVLIDAGRPMHILQIARDMLRRGFKYEKDEAALRASLTGSIERKKSTFRRVAKATYGLTAWPE